MKKIFKWLGMGTLGLIILGAIVGPQGKHDQIATLRSPVAETGSIERQPEIYQVSASKLFDAYEANEVATDEVLKNKIVEVTGVVQSIDKDFLNNMILGLKTGNQFMPARLQIVDGQKQTVMGLRNGQKVALRCARMSRILGSPSGRDCEIVGS